MDQADVLDADGDADTTETTRSFYHRNALGSVMEITELDEDVAVSYRYDTYGAVTITRSGNVQSSDPLGQPWTYTGRFSDEETRLYYYRARYYSSATGRFLQRDPLGLRAGFNLYRYARNAPLVYSDPSGLMEPITTGVVVTAVILAYAAYVVFDCLDWFGLTESCYCDIQISAHVKEGSQLNSNNSTEEDRILLHFKLPGIECDDKIKCRAPCKIWSDFVEAKVDAYSAAVNAGAEPPPPDLEGDMGYQTSGINFERFRRVTWGREEDTSAPTVTAFDGQDDESWSSSNHSTWEVNNFTWDCDA